MEFLIVLLILNAIILGANFSFFLVGGLPFQKDRERAPLHMGKKRYSVERLAVGISTSTLGVSWLVAWVYFMMSRWDSFVIQFDTLLLHVSLQLLAALILILAGIALFGKWKRSRGIFLTSMALLMGSIVLAIAIYGPRGHGSPLFMYLFGMSTLVVGVMFTTAAYLLGRLLHDWDEQLPKNQPT